MSDVPAIPARRRRWRFGLAAGVLLGIVVGMVVWRQVEQHSSIAEVTLPDGKHKLRLLRVTDGPLDYEWSDRLGFLRGKAAFGVTILPGKAIPPISVHLDGTSTTPGVANRASFLFRTVDLNGDYFSPLAHPMPVYFVEESGFVFPITHLRHVPLPWGTYAFTSESVPRRDKELRIHITQKHHDTTVEMRLPNPFYRDDFPQWSPEPLPATQTVNTMTATFKGFKCEQLWPNAKALRRAVPDVEVTSTTPGEFKGAMMGYIYYDATGNSSSALSPFEKAWKVNFSAFRDADSVFPAEWVHSLGEMTLPKRGEVEFMHQRITVSGVDLTVHCLTGGNVITKLGKTWTATPLPDDAGISPDSPPLVMGSSHPTSDEPVIEIAGNAPYVLIEFPRLRGYVLLRVRHDGKQALPLKTSYADFGRNRLLAGGLPFAAGTANVELEVIVNHGEVFEFIVEPPQELRDHWLKNDNEPLWPNLKTSPVSGP